MDIIDVIRDEQELDRLLIEELNEGECDPDDLEMWYDAWLEGWDVPDAILAKLDLLADAECELQAERECNHEIF